MQEIYHIPVFGTNIVSLLQVQEQSIILDCTAGEGGHAAIFLQHATDGFYYGFDRDAAVLAVAEERLAAYKGRFLLFHDTYANAPSILQEKSLPLPDIVLVDLGISMFQLRMRGRGFSFKTEDPLCMRFDSDETALQAFDVVNHYPETKLADVIYKYGEERASRKIAYWIVRERQRKQIQTCSQLASLVARAKGYRKGRIHPATQTFQALRIEVNQELSQLQKLLQVLPNIVRPKGLVGFISYHSIEDRMLKIFSKESIHFTQVNKKVIRPPLEELEKNPAARSAKLRIIQRNE